MCEFLTIEELLSVEGLEAEADVSYIPLPNIVDIVISEELAPDHLTPTAFVFPFFDNGDLMMAHNRRRQVEVPGGHRDPMAGGEIEHPRETARREGFEETGVVVEDIVPVGFMRARSAAEGVPSGYRYPFPVSCQQFFAARIASVVEFNENDECLAPVRLSESEVEEVLSGRSLALYRAARATMFPVSTIGASPHP